MSTSWFMVADQMIIGSGDFLLSITPDYRHVCAAEICGYLAALQIIDKFCSSQNDSSQIELFIANNCLGVTHELERKSTVESMSTICI